MKNNADDIANFFISSKKTLQAQAKQAAIIGHKGSIGTVRERTLMEFLRPFLPVNYQMTKSKIIDTKRMVSSEFDIVISNLLWSPSIFERNGVSPVFVENVVAVIEVKSSVDKKAIDDFGEKLKLLSKLTRRFEYSELLRCIQSIYTSLCIYLEKQHLIKGLKYKLPSELKLPFEVGALKCGDEFSPIAPIRTVLFGYRGVREEALLKYINGMLFKPDLVLILDVGAFCCFPQENTYRNVIIPEKHRNLELAYMALVLTDWLDKSNTDRTFVKSRLELYL
jgi:hypothetical protein